MNEHLNEPTADIQGYRLVACMLSGGVLSLTQQSVDRQPLHQN